MEKVISIRNLYFSYDGNFVLEDVNLDIYKGDYLGIVGPNGSGKSTLIKLILNILNPLRGTIKILGQDIKNFNDWGKIGYVAQKASSFNTSFPATVQEIVAANLYSRIGLFKPINKKYLDKVHHVLEITGMEDYAGRLIGSLSGGQQQKVFIARALVSSPEILFLDEPTVGIDIESQKEFYELLERLNEEMDITIVIISHDIGVIAQKANRVACMGNKKLVVHSNSRSKSWDSVVKELYGDKVNILIHNH